MKMKVTKSSVEAITFTETGQLVIRDTELIGFGVCVGKRTKTYIAQREVQGRTIRVKIGRHELMTAEEARREARQALAKIERGEVPRHQESAKSVHTLSEALESYFEERKGLRATTVDTYRRVLRLYLPDWTNLPLEEITRDMVVARHAQIGEERGHAVANTAMRVFRAIYNYAAALNEDLPPNPTSRLSQTRSWYPEKRRRSWVTPSQLKTWYAAVENCGDDSMRDFLTLILFTGLRRSEALRLRWENVDLVERILTITETKNHEPLTLPVSDFLLRLLERRRKEANGSEWVFPGRVHGHHLCEPKKAIAKIRETSGIEFTLHDLRRTFITIAESLDIPAYSLKRLINHKSAGDVTAGYIIIGVERLRRPMEQIGSFFEAAIRGEHDGQYS